MPTYDYECSRCGTMEIFQSMKDDTLKKCPQCASAKFRKLVSRGAGIIFKGEGFWETDYNRSADYKKQANGEKGEGAAASGGSGGSGDSAASSPTKGDSGANAAAEKKPAASAGSSEAASQKTAPQKSAPTSTSAKPAAS